LTLNNFNVYMIEIAQLLLQARPSLSHQVDVTGSSPLHYAASIGDHRMIQLLLHHDASIAYLLDKDGLSPIHVAATMGYTGIITELIKHCPDVVELTDKKGRNFLHVAIENKTLQVVKYVLNNPTLKELLNEADRSGNTPLHYATISHNLEAVHLLLADERIDTRSRNHKGLTPLDLASLCVDSSIRLRMVCLTISIPMYMIWNCFALCNISNSSRETRKPAKPQVEVNLPKILVPTL